ncbi:MAG: hypothetical protein ACI9FJ_002116 [Alteromonadaceae bacterium]|jgi:hypothetical protein
MIRLSRKGWNNVLIFAMLMMIMVFNGMHTKFNSGDAENIQVTLLPEDSLVLTLEYPNAVVERIGQIWRSKPPLDITAEQLLAIMNDWQNQLVELQVDENEAKVMTQGKMPQYYVIARLAGKEEGAVYAFYLQFDHVWIHDQQQARWLKAPIELTNALIPTVLGQNP